MLSLFANNPGAHRMIAGWLQIIHSEVAINPGSNEIIVANNPGLKMSLPCRSERLALQVATVMEGWHIWVKVRNK